MTKLQYLANELQKTEWEIEAIKKEMNALGSEWSESYEALEVELGALSDYYNDTVDYYNKVYDNQLMTDYERSQVA